MQWSIAGFLISLGLVACSSSAGPTLGSTPTPSGIAASDKNGPVEVAALLFPDSGAACGHSGDYGPCPMTPELRRRLAANPIQYVDQLFRLTSQYHTPKFPAMPASDETGVRVDPVLDPGQQPLQVVVTHPHGARV